MLGKLIRYEFKAVNRLMIPLHLGLILVTIIGRFYIQFAYYNSRGSYYSGAMNKWEGLLELTLMSFYVMALMAAAIITFVYLCAQRFQTNLFTDEGYLMHTLPVSASEHIVSKLIVAFSWCVADVILVALSIFSMFVNKDVLMSFGDIIRDLITSFPETFGASAVVGLPLMLITGIVQTLARILVVYACISIGYSFNRHKLLSSVGIYVGYTIITNILSTILAALRMPAVPGSRLFFIIGRAGDFCNGALYFWLTFGFTLLLNAGIGIGAFLIARYFMTRRLNLE